LIFLTQKEKIVDKNSQDKIIASDCLTITDS